jgi:hypothetical protein
MDGILGKVMAGWLSVSALLFSSFTGNEPVFRPLQCKAGSNYLLVTARLDDAFENDFGDVFKCGRPVVLNYKIEVRNAGETAFSATYRHTVTYDPMTASWAVEKSETRTREIISTYSLMLEEISHLECTIARNNRWKSVEINAEAWLLPVNTSQSNKTIDLMVLWKYKRPATRTVFNLPPIS